MTTIGQAYADSLTVEEREALKNGGAILIDLFLDDLRLLEENADFEETSMFDYLPSQYALKYTPHFARQFLVCLITVFWKMAQPDHLPLASVAEELAAFAIVTQAKDEDEEGHPRDEAFLESFVDAYFEDTDFLYLFDDEYDGIDETDLADIQGISSLAFADWFKPFSDEPERAPHPYVE